MSDTMRLPSQIPAGREVSCHVPTEDSERTIISMLITTGRTVPTNNRKARRVHSAR